MLLKFLLSSKSPVVILRFKSNWWLHLNQCVIHYCLYYFMWSYIWNISYIELRMSNKVSYDPRGYERSLCNCVCRSLKRKKKASTYACNCINWVHNCEDHSLLAWFTILVSKCDALRLQQKRKRHSAKYDWRGLRRVRIKLTAKRTKRYL